MQNQIEQREKNIIVKFTSYFIKNSRLTILLIPVLLIGGLFAYQNLERDGFPPIEIPTVIITTPYFVNDVSKVDSDVTSRLEELIKEVDGVKTFTSTTTENFSRIVVTFNDDVSSEEGARRIEQKYAQNKFLPKDSSPNITPIKVASRDNKSDMIFSIANPNFDIRDLQKVAAKVAEKISQLPEIKEAYVIEQIKNRINPITKESIEVQESFGRFVVKKDDGQFYSFDAVSIGIVKASDDFGTLDISKAVRSKIEKLQQPGGLLDGFVISYNGDFADNLNQQISLLETNVVSAILIIIIIMFILINWRSSLLLALFFPITLGSIFLALLAIGYSLNTITLFSLILVVGLLIDDGIIVVEAVDLYKKQGYKGFNAVRKAIEAIGIADLLGTITTLLVFVPLLFVTGPLGEFIRFIPVTVIVSLTISLLVALSIITFLSGVFLTDKSSTKKLGLIARILLKVENITLSIGKALGKFVNFYLQSKILTILVILITFICIGVGGYFASRLKFNIFPPTKDSNTILISINFNNMNIDEAILTSKKIDEKIIQVLGNNLKEYEYFRANQDVAFININLIPLDQREATSVELGKKLKEVLGEVQNVSFTINTSVTGPTADPRPFKMQVFSDNVENLKFIAEDFKDFLQSDLLNDFVAKNKLTGIGDDFVTGDFNVLSKKDGKRYVQIEVGFGDNEYTSATIANLRNEVEEKWIPKIIQNESLELSKNSFTFDAGITSANAESFASLQTAFIISLFVMYILLMVQFNSFLQPFLILLAVPFSFVLLFPGLYLTNNDLSFFVTLGLTALIGIVVNNSIVLIEYTNQARSKGMGIRESISSAISQRFRPIVTTTLTSVIGLLPLALTDPFWEALALTIVFGLSSSTIFVLLSYPAFFAVIEKIRTVATKAFTQFIQAKQD
ncbi:MAG: efflux RND transporter permease subunit [Candidatus Dojkabacteria bacterium]|nr:efflux RND transporter permease subunit [Candidatus Dojkabacteria bacterium]